MTEPREDPSRLVRAVFIVLGTVSLVLGVIGILLPLVPTTPFLLLTAACYARGSARLNRWLVTHPRLGPYINDWRRDHSVPRRAKVTAIAMVWVSFGLAVYFVVDSLWARIVYLAIVVAVTAFLASLRSTPKKGVARSPLRGSHEL